MVAMLNDVQQHAIMQEGCKGEMYSNMHPSLNSDMLQAHTITYTSAITYTSTKTYTSAIVIAIAVQLCTSRSYHAVISVAAYQH
jgi:hypothetical protein